MPAAVRAPIVSPSQSRFSAGVRQARNYVFSVYGSSGTAATTQILINPGEPWQYWNAAYTTTSATSLITLPQWQSWNFQAEETAEVRAARDAELAALRAEQERQREEHRKRQLVITSRAEELLMSLLTDEQARSYIDNGWFEVRGSRGGRYRIRNRGQAGNVDLMPGIGNERELSYCCHPPGGLPDADAHVAQMLHLVTDEDGFRKTANISYRRPLAAETAGGPEHDRNLRAVA